MPFPQDNLNVLLWFMDELRDVQIIAVTEGREFPFQYMATIRESKSLRKLLEKIEIDYVIYQRQRDFAWIAEAHTPQAIVSGLERAFESFRNIGERILEGQTPTDEEMRRMPLRDLRVCSSSLKTTQGLNLVKEWFHGTPSKA